MAWYYENYMVTQDEATPGAPAGYIWQGIGFSNGEVPGAPTGNGTSLYILQNDPNYQPPQQTQTQQQPDQTLTTENQYGAPQKEFVKGFLAEPTNIYSTINEAVTGKEDDLKPQDTLFGKGLDSIWKPIGEIKIQTDTLDNFFNSFGGAMQTVGGKVTSQKYYSDVSENFGKLGYEIQQRPYYYAGTAAFEIGTAIIPFGKIGTVASKSASAVTKIIAETQQGRKALEILAKENRQIQEASKIAESIKPQGTITGVEKTKGTTNNFVQSIISNDNALLAKKPISKIESQFDKSENTLSKITNDLKNDGVKFADNTDSKFKENIMILGSEEKDIVKIIDKTNLTADDLVKFGANDPKKLTSITPEISTTTIKTGRKGTTELYYKEDFAEVNTQASKAKAEITQSAESISEYLKRFGLSQSDNQLNITPNIKTKITVIGDLEKSWIGDSKFYKIDDATSTGFKFTHEAPNLFTKENTTMDDLIKIFQLEKAGLVDYGMTGIEYSNKIIKKNPDVFREFVKDASKLDDITKNLEPKSKEYIFVTKGYGIKQLDNPTTAQLVKNPIHDTDTFTPKIGSDVFEFWLQFNKNKKSTFGGKPENPVHTPYDKTFGQDDPVKKTVEEFIEKRGAPASTILDDAVNPIAPKTPTPPPPPTPSRSGDISTIITNEYVYKPFLLTPKSINNNINFGISESNQNIFDLNIKPIELTKLQDKIKTRNDLFTISDVMPDSDTKFFLWQDEKQGQKESTKQSTKLITDTIPGFDFTEITIPKPKEDEKILDDHIFKTGWAELTIPVPDPPPPPDPTIKIPPKTPGIIFDLPDPFEEKPKEKKKQKLTKQRKRVWNVGLNPFDPFEKTGYKDSKSKDKDDNLYF